MYNRELNLMTTGKYISQAITFDQINNDNTEKYYKVTRNETIDEYVLIRLVTSAITYRYINIIGELIDVSIVKSNDEISYINKYANLIQEDDEMF